MRMDTALPTYMELGIPSVVRFDKDLILMILLEIPLLKERIIISITKYFVNLERGMNDIFIVKKKNKIHGPD